MPLFLVGIFQTAAQVGSADPARSTAVIYEIAKVVFGGMLLLFAKGIYSKLLQILKVVNRFHDHDLRIKRIEEHLRDNCAVCLGTINEAFSHGIMDDRRQRPRFRFRYREASELASEDDDGAER